MKEELMREFGQIVMNFWKEHKSEIRVSEMRSLIISAAESFKGSPFYHANESVDGISEKDKDDFKEMWNSFVQQTIDYINSHPEVKKRVLESQEKINREWNCSLGADINVHFNADWIEESLESGKWEPGTDSHLGLYVARTPILNMY